MKKHKFQKQLEKLKEDDFLPGLYESWSIYILEHEYSVEKRYMNIGFDSYQQAKNEMERIKRKHTYFKIEVRKSMVRRLKKPISCS